MPHSDMVLKTFVEDMAIPKIPLSVYPDMITIRMVMTHMPAIYMVDPTLYHMKLRAKVFLSTSSN